MWHIVPQSTKWGDVKCKTLRWCAIEDKETGEVTMRRMSPIIQVVLSVPNSTRLTKVKFNVKSRTWVIQMPDTMTPVTFKSRGEVHVDHLADPITKRGDRLSFASISVFYAKLITKFGESMANEIVQLMHEEMHAEEI